MDRTVPALANLAVFLRERRDTAGLTYQQLALREGMPSKATLERAASGASVPSWSTVYAFIDATATTPQLFVDTFLHGAGGLTRGRDLWIRARRATRAPYYVHKAPDPELICSVSDLSQALRDQHTWAGCPSPGDMERKFPHHLPRSTTRRIINGTTLPATPEQTIALLKACHVISPASLTPWLAAAIRAFEKSNATSKAIDKWVETRELFEALVTPDHEEEFPPVLRAA
ncbi:helix-turn-helix domain-containing protein [Streptomyces sp. NPDC060366]|uniref:helix-turn-helix domain-containing protein n=1 Tax=Streptomyces sp. NPDC060366 TaxID=3347105 RepID=UPI0036664C6C